MTKKEHAKVDNIVLWLLLKDCDLQKIRERSYQQEMSENQSNQMPILIPSIQHPRPEGQRRISGILDENPIIPEMVMQDFISLIPNTDGNPLQHGILSIMRMVVFRKGLEKAHLGMSSCS
jgi:hypothetical protein